MPLGAKRLDGEERGPRAPALRSRAVRALTAEHVGEALVEWQARELRLARGFPECRGLSAEQLEDFYQDTAIVLLRRPYQSEEHLRNALRWGIKRRALQQHRDERRRGEILEHGAPELHVIGQAREDETLPELAAVLEEDRLVVSEFLTELTAQEQHVFWLMAEGMRYRAIAPALGITVNEARKTSRVCERKRERFQLLYDTGRLCGFRAATIQALQAGQATSEHLARQAFAHLEGCSHCRAEHKTNARRLRRTFQGQAAALLPIPALAGRLGWLARLDLRVRTVQQRLLPDGASLGTGGVRERAAVLLAGGGVAGKVAAGVATVAVIAGGTIGATHVLDRPLAHHRGSRSVLAAPIPQRTGIAARVLPSPAPLAGARRQPPYSAGRQRRSGSEHPLPRAHAAGEQNGAARREPGGFAYLGVPTGTAPAGTGEGAHAAVAGGGGPFTP
jgi:RNA polymerase sigma factor (sigma-70 family)